MVNHLTSVRRSRVLLSSLALLCGLVVMPSQAAAHFELQTPASWMSQDGLGSPQKAPPCGNEGGGTETGLITAFQAGQTVTITINETIFHPGHYRVALAPNDPSELPAEPIVTPGSDTPCGTVPIMDPPVYPVLADGMLVHTSPLGGVQTFEITLPDDVTCEHCTLQIIEFMSEHPLNNPGGCFYHHCANVSISSVTVGTGGTAGGAGESGASGAGTSGAGATNGASGTGNPSGASGASGANGAGGATSGVSGATSGASGTTSATAGTSGSAAVTSGDDGGCNVLAPGSTGVSGLGILVGLAALARRRR